MIIKIALGYLIGRIIYNVLEDRAYAFEDYVRRNKLYKK